jgi:GxxExxY protein
LKYNSRRGNNAGVKTLPDLKHEEIAGPLIELLYHVYRTLGFGFLEKIYGSAMMIAGKRFGLRIVDEVPIKVAFEGIIIGNYSADLLVNDAVLVELKSARTLAPEHEAQLLNYLKATRYEVGFLFNFGPTPQYKRMAFDNSRKGNLTWLGR